MTATMSSSGLLSLATVGTARWKKIADLCDVPISSIEDVYTCTPLQASMIAATRDEVFHFVLSSEREIDIDGFCAALRKVVAANSILRTRIVHSDVDGLSDLVQVVTNEPHVTELQTGYDDVESFLDGDDDAPHHHFAPHALLFRSAVVGRSFVVTMHHAIADYWSMEKLLKVDLPIVYFGQPPAKRTAFKSFVAQCLSKLDETTARNFWVSRFKGTPAIFPASTAALRSPEQHPFPSVSAGSVGARPTRMMPLSPRGGGISPSHMAFYVEAAWVLTAALYADSDSIAYGYVLSGRSPDPAGVENTLGPTITEIPVQAHVRRATMTVERLIRDRAAALRSLQQQEPAVLQYGLAKVAGVSEAARTCAGFQALINIRPSVFTDANTGTSVDEANFRFRMIWLRGYYPLQFIFSITEDGVMVWPRTNPAVVSDAQLDRILNQYEHCLRVLTDAAPQTKLANLPLLDPQARSAIFRGNQSLLDGAAEQCIEQVFSDQALARFFRPWSTKASAVAEEQNIKDEVGADRPVGFRKNIRFPPGCGIWITTSENPDQLAPWGAVGEVLVQGIWGASGEAQVDSHPWIPSPTWGASSPSSSASEASERKEKTRFFRTGVLAKYETNGSISLVGRMSNRVKLGGGQVVQLEELEGVVAGCSQVRDFVAATRILGGQTVLVGIICFTDRRLPRGQVLNRLLSGPGGGVDNGHDKAHDDNDDDEATMTANLVDAEVEAVRLWTQSRLPANRVPSLWLPVEELPRTLSSEDVDRVALRDWLLMTLRSR